MSFWNDIPKVTNAKLETAMASLAKHGEQLAGAKRAAARSALSDAIKARQHVAVG